MNVFIALFVFLGQGKDPNETDLSEETGGISHHRKSEDKIPVRHGLTWLKQLIFSNCHPQIPRLTLAGHRNMVSKVAWLEEAGQTQPKLVSCSWDQTIRVWDVTASASDTTGKCGESRCISVGSPLHDLSVATQGVLVGASDNKVRIYDLRAKDALAQIGFQGHTAWLSSVSWAPHRQDQFVTGSVDQSVRLWDTRNLASSLYDLIGHTDMVTCVDWAAPVLQGMSGSGDKQPQHYILSSSGDGTADTESVVSYSLPTLSSLNSDPLLRRMPLILLCGYPCSGKSAVVTLLAGCLHTHRPDCQIEVVSEESIASAHPAATTTIDPRVAIYMDANLEKQLRAEIKSQASSNLQFSNIFLLLSIFPRFHSLIFHQNFLLSFSPLLLIGRINFPVTERALTGKKPSNTIVIVDANNYIKGYRYELYCTAKSMRHQQAILHCTTGLDTCREINTALGRYPEAVFSEVVTRFERPNSSSRWDNPLYEICLPQELEQERDNSRQDLRALVDKLTDRILSELLSSGTRVRPNQSTVPTQAADSNYLQVLLAIVDLATTEVISAILAAQTNGTDFASLPPHLAPPDSGAAPKLDLTDGFAWTASTLTKAKRQYLSFLRANATQLASTKKRTTPFEAAVLFMHFLNNEAQRTTFLS
ncbi:unnamed protein product [Schistocephalus solidus]|uniref:Protein KTI12 homolog n=1 Tax=Schistocephalus solidus TaxID=70667 RepID=A0A3P7CI86_SCHSO|nr:unnamed protein product [Schistocephalus solidus]